MTANGQTTTFVYDGDGRRVKKTDAGGTTFYPSEHYEVKGGVVTKYYYLGGQRVAMKVGSTVYWLHGDHLGSASLTTNSSGGIYAQQRYTPYGEVRWSSGTLPTDLQYTGQRRETTLGIYDYKARFYSPRLGRFLSADTLVPGVGSQHLSRYMYVTGNPVKYNDPTGHARPTDESENANKPFSPMWFMRRYPYNQARALDEAQKWLEKHQDYNIFADPDAWGVNNGELVPRNPYLQQMYVLWRGARGEQELLIEQAKAQQKAWLDLGQQIAQHVGKKDPWSLVPIAIGMIGGVWKLGNRSPGEIAGDTPFLPNQRVVDWSYVEKYAQSMREGKFNWNGMRDKIQILRADNGMFVLGGHHRVLAAQLAGVKIPSSVIEYIDYSGECWLPSVQGWGEVQWSGY